MRELDRMLLQARKLDILTRDYVQVCIIRPDDTGAWGGVGIDQTFDSRSDATHFCREQAAGRPLVIIVDDIPRPDPIKNPGEDLHDVACFSPLKFVEGGEEE